MCGQLLGFYGVDPQSGHIVEVMNPITHLLYGFVAFAGHGHIVGVCKVCQRKRGSGFDTVDAHHGLPENAVDHEDERCGRQRELPTDF